MSTRKLERKGNKRKMKQKKQMRRIREVERKKLKITGKENERQKGKKREE